MLFVFVIFVGLFVSFLSFVICFVSFAAVATHIFYSLCGVRECARIKSDLLTYKREPLKSETTTTTAFCIQRFSIHFIWRVVCNGCYLPFDKRTNRINQCHGAFSISGKVHLNEMHICREWTRVETGRAPLVICLMHHITLFSSIFLYVNCVCVLCMHAYIWQLARHIMFKCAASAPIPFCFVFISHCTCTKLILFGFFRPF